VQDSIPSFGNVVLAELLDSELAIESSVDCCVVRVPSSRVGLQELQSLISGRS
jgi:hypothetical protein